MRGVGSGDKLARGAVRASYLVSENVIEQKKWDEMFADFDPDKFKKSAPSDPDAKKSDSIGNVVDSE